MKRRRARLGLGEGRNARPYSITEDASRKAKLESQIADTRKKLLAQFVNLEKQLQRLTYQDQEKKKQHLDFVKSLPRSFEMATADPHSYLRAEAVRVDAFMYSIEEMAAEAIANYQFTIKSSKDEKYTPGRRIVGITSDIRSSIAVLLNYSKELADVSIPPQEIAKPKIPGQKPAPINVGISRDVVLRISNPKTHDGKLPERSLEDLRAATAELLSRTIDQMGYSSNIDPRLLPNCRGLLNYLSKDMLEVPVVFLGLNLRFSQRSFNVTKDTVPDAIIEQLDQIFSTVNIIVVQYKEWRDYCAAEGAAIIPSNDLPTVIDIAKEATDNLEENSSIVDPTVPNRFREITDAYSTGLINAESAAAPLLESLGNVFSEISRFVVMHVADMGVNVNVALGAPGAVVLFLGFAVKMVESFAPTLSAFPPLSYLIDVQKYIHKQFSLLKDSLPNLSEVISKFSI